MANVKMAPLIGSSEVTDSCFPASKSNTAPLLKTKCFWYSVAVLVFRPAGTGLHI